jgi:hypothetical protein
MRKRTPLRACRKQCLDCMGNSSDLVRDCSTTHCKIWEFRLGRGRPKRSDIHAFCLECVGGVYQEAVNCTAAPGAEPYHTCSFWRLRPGTKWRKTNNPTGKGGFSK